MPALSAAARAAFGLAAALIFITDLYEAVEPFLLLIGGAR